MRAKTLVGGRRCLLLSCLERRGPLAVMFDLVLELGIGSLELADPEGALGGFLSDCRRRLRLLVDVLIHLGAVVSAQCTAEVDVGVGHRVPVAAEVARWSGSVCQDNIRQLC